MSRLIAGVLPLLFLASGVDAKPIKVSSVSSLNFGTAAPGDPAKTIAPGTSETSANASFQITGDANRAYSIVLPSSGTLNFKQGPTTDSITVNAFLSYPSTSGLLNAAGEQSLYVGATRASLRLNQTAGSYSGNFAVTVVY